MIRSAYPGEEDAKVTIAPVPPGFHTVTPYLMAADPAALIDFLKAAFDAEEMHRTLRPDGGIMHAQVRIGDSMLMMGGAMTDWPAMPAGLYLYVAEADETYARAIDAGATSVTPPSDQFWGDRMGGVKDTWGNFWWIATHVEDVAPEEIAKRAQAAMCQSK